MSLDLHSVTQFWFASAHASTGTGIEDVFNILVTLVLALCGGACVIACAKAGLKAWFAHDYGALVQDMVGLGIGAALVFGARPLSARMLGSATAAVLTPGVATAMVGDFLGHVVFYGVTVGGSMLAWLRARRGH